MSMFGRSSNAPSGAVNSERMEMAIQEYVYYFPHVVHRLDTILQVGHGH
jgi:hypothetical protein